MKNDAAHLLRRHGVQVTAQRLAVLAAVSRQPHGTADDVAQVATLDLPAKFPRGIDELARVTRQPADVGEVRRQPVGDGSRGDAPGAPRQRPARMSSPSETGEVQGMQPIEG